MSGAFSKLTMLTPEILICSSLIASPPNRPETSIKRSETILSDYNVGTILNVASDVEPKPHHKDLYKRLKITHHSIPIDDTMEQAPPADFLDQVVTFYNEKHDKDRALLINCQMGINRSAFAAAAILYTKLRIDPEKLIQDMRVKQRDQRGLVLLSNHLFTQTFIQWTQKCSPK
jgi:predicted protein tyrosine phosphatase